MIYFLSVVCHLSVVTQVYCDKTTESRITHLPLNSKKCLNFYHVEFDYETRRDLFDRRLQLGWVLSMLSLPSNISKMAPPKKVAQKR